ncbi:MAG: 16S rRNA (uracil(1498)-N(3))-methyltransferase [Candidatus Dormibacteraeota bacterium]|nr:16S rRNA (uracil(1498)-N(3))-methyltransferase [Candidatus Dormibacteraeota bacterium]
MPQRFFVNGGDIASDGLVMEGAVANHIARSLRMRSGDSIVVVDDRNREHGVLLRSVRPERIEGEVSWTRPVTGEPVLRITVVQALPRERMEDCVDLLVEVGAAEIRPVITERVVSRTPGDRFPNRVHRWQAVATESAQLAGRGSIPRVHSPVALDDALAALDKGTRLLACTFDANHPLAELAVDSASPLALCVGPEGGFGAGDLETLRQAGAQPVHMGARILRTRYASAIGCALLLAGSGDLADAVAAAPAR